MTLLATLEAQFLELAGRLREHDPPTRQAYRASHGVAYMWGLWALHWQAMAIREQRKKNLYWAIVVERLRLGWEPRRAMNEPIDPKGTKAA